MKIMSKDGDSNGVLLLWRTWIFEALRRGNLTEASALVQSVSLIPLALDEPQRGTLRSKAAFTRTDDLLQLLLRKAIVPPMSPQQSELLVLTTDLLAMLRYCESKGELVPALDSYQNVLDVVGKHDFRRPPREILEIMHQHRAHLIHLHVSSNKGRFEPKRVLKTLKASLEAYGNNSILVKLHDQYLHKNGLIDRLRGIASQALTDDDDDGLLQHMQHIHREMSMLEELGTTEHSIRAAFHRANDDDSEACHCPVTRLAHVRWEIGLLKRQAAEKVVSKKTMKKQTERAVQALHAAIRACPWVKELYVLAFESEAMREALGLEGLKQVYETMLERGLRVHIDISDRIEKQSR